MVKIRKITPYHIDIADERLARPVRTAAHSMTVNAVHTCHPPCVHLAEVDHKIICGLADGLTYRQIALRVGLAESHTKNRVAALLAKLAVPNSTALVALAFRAGIIQ